MVKAKVMYLGPLAATAHKGPSGIIRNFFRNRWQEYDFSEEDLKHYAESGGFKVEKVSIFKRIKKPVFEIKEEEIIIGG